MTDKAISISRHFLLFATLALEFSLSRPAFAQTILLAPGAIPPEDVVQLVPSGLEKGLAQLPQTVRDILMRSGVPGAAVAVVHGGETVFAQGFGVREIGKDAKVDERTVFQLASLSKPLAATVAAIEVHRGTVRWDDRITKHLPDFGLKDPYVSGNATIGDFYSHRSGLPHAAGDDLEDLGFDRKTVIERLRLLPLKPFRITFNYSNFGLTIGAEAIAAAAGLPWENLSERDLYNPLGMNSTSSRYRDFLARTNRSAIHAFQSGQFAPLYHRDADQQSPAGGVSSSVLDLAEWLKLILGNGRYGGVELISPSALLPAMRAQGFSAPASTIGSRSGFYGFGFNISVNANGRPTMGHSGAFTLGAGTQVQFLPSAGLAIVVLTNGGPIGVAEAISNHFMELAQFGEITRDWYALFHPLLMQNYSPVGDLVGKPMPTAPSLPRPLDAYVGVYDNAYFGPAQISREGNALFLHLGPGAVVMPMTHWDGDIFSVTPHSENAPYGSRSSVRFSFKEDQANALEIDYLNENDMAHWAR